MVTIYWLCSKTPRQGMVIRDAEFRKVADLVQRNRCGALCFYDPCLLEK